MATTSTNPVDVTLFVKRADKSDTYYQAVMNLLSDGRWHSAKSIVTAIPELDTRDVRDIRKRARGAIIGGSKGYRLTIHATSEEIKAYVGMCYKNMRDYQQNAVNVENFRIRRRIK